MAIEITKHGGKGWHATCSNCGCEFTYEDIMDACGTIEELKRQKELEIEVQAEAKRIKEGYIAVVGNKIGATYKGKPTEAILEIIKQKITAEVFYSYAYIVDVKDINTKIWEFNKEMNNAHPKLKALLNSFDKIHGEGRENGNKSN